MARGRPQTTLRVGRQTGRQTEREGEEKRREGGRREGRRGGLMFLGDESPDQRTDSGTGAKKEGPLLPNTAKTGMIVR